VLVLIVVAVSLLLLLLLLLLLQVPAKVERPAEIPGAETAETA
jgi:hypothetical protein